MDWTLPLDTNPAKIIEFVREHGIAVLPGYLSNRSLLEQALEEVLDTTQQSNTPYKFGNAARFGPTVPKKLVATQKLICDPKCLELDSQYGLTRESIYMTHEFKSGGEWERNGYLHFDRIFTFKLLIYLSDVDQRCGPFSAIMDTHKQMEPLRTAEWKRTSAYEAIRNRPVIDYPELGYTENDGIPVLGPAGTLIVFSTDTLHKGGLVEKGHQRILVRTHCR